MKNKINLPGLVAETIFSKVVDHNYLSAPYFSSHNSVIMQMQRVNAQNNCLKTCQNIYWMCKFFGGTNSFCDDGVQNCINECKTGY